MSRHGRLNGRTEAGEAFGLRVMNDESRYIQQVVLWSKAMQQVPNPTEEPWLRVIFDPRADSSADVSFAEAPRPNEMAVATFLKIGA